MLWGFLLILFVGGVLPVLLIYRQEIKSWAEKRWDRLRGIEPQVRLRKRACPLARATADLLDEDPDGWVDEGAYIKHPATGAGLQRK